MLQGAPGGGAQYTALHVAGAAESDGARAATGRG